MCLAFEYINIIFNYRYHCSPTTMENSILPADLFHQILLECDRMPNFIYTVCQYFAKLFPHTITQLRERVYYKSKPSITDATLCKLVNLQAVDLYYDGLVSGEGLFNLTKLTTLRIRHIDVIYITQLQNLTTLTMTHGTPNITLMTHLPLRKLVLPCVVYGQTTLDLLTKLTCLSSLSVTGPNCDVVYRLTRLRSLTLNGRTIHPRELTHTNLTKLKLYQCHLSSALSQIPNLTKLSLEHMGVNMHTVSEVKSLRYLHLGSGVDVCDRNMVHFTNITHLNLSRNSRITYHGIKMLTNIKTLNLYNNEIIHPLGIDIINDYRYFTKYHSVLFTPPESYYEKYPLRRQRIHAEYSYNHIRKHMYDTILEKVHHGDKQRHDVDIANIHLEVSW